MRRDEKSSHVVGHPGPVLAIAVLLMAGLWILFVSGLRLQEMIIGVGAVIFSALFLYGVARTSPLALDFQLRDIIQFWRIPWYLLTDTWTIIVVLCKDLAGRPAGSFYRVCGFDTSLRDPQRKARTVLATVYTTATPNSIVLGIDAAQSRMLFHQLQRSSITKMAQALGAKP